MKIFYLPSARQIAEVQQFFSEVNQSDEFYQRRLTNLLPAEEKEPITKERFWQEMFLAICTTLSKSGPTSGIAMMERKIPFPGRWERLAASDDVNTLVWRILRKYNVWMATKKAAAIDYNFTLLSGEDDVLWSKLSEWLKALRLCPSQQPWERRAAGFLKRHFKQIGSKQARNILQGLGLTTHEFPIDSRVVRWLVKFGFIRASQQKPLLQSIGASQGGRTMKTPEKQELCASNSEKRCRFRYLQQRKCLHFQRFIVRPPCGASKKRYCALMDDLQELCKACDIIPCLLDAAIFLHYDDCECECRG